MKKSTVVEVDSIEGFQEIIRTPEPVLVDYYADWCGPCKALAPNIERVAAANAGRLRVLKVNIDAVPELARRARVREVPALHFYRDGRKVAVLSGFRTAEALTGELTRYGLISETPATPEEPGREDQSGAVPAKSWWAQLLRKSAGRQGAEDAAPARASSFRFLESEGELAAVIDSSFHANAAIFLHDPWCPISARAFRQMEHLGSELPTIDVSRQRLLSAEVERRTGVRHQSPQVIVLRDAIATWDASHGGVTAANVRAALCGPALSAAGAVTGEDAGR